MPTVKAPLARGECELAPAAEPSRATEVIATVVANRRAATDLRRLDFRLLPCIWHSSSVRDEIGDRPPIEGEPRNDEDQSRQVQHCERGRLAPRHRCDRRRWGCRRSVL